MRPCTTGISVLIGMKSITCAISPSRRDKVEVLATKGHAKGGVSFRARGPDSAQATVLSGLWGTTGGRERETHSYTCITRIKPEMP